MIKSQSHKTVLLENALERRIIIVSVTILIVVLAGFAIYSSLRPPFPSESVTASNLTTYTIDCAGVPVCGDSSATSFSGTTTTVIVFEYPTSDTTSYVTLTLAHPTTTIVTGCTVVQGSANGTTTSTGICTYE
jgi:hypothetical protein